MSWRRSEVAPSRAIIGTVITYQRTENRHGLSQYRQNNMRPTGHAAIVRRGGSETMGTKCLAHPNGTKHIDANAQGQGSPTPKAKAPQRPRAAAAAAARHDDGVVSCYPSALRVLPCAGATQIQCDLLALKHLGHSTSFGQPRASQRTTVSI